MKSACRIVSLFSNNDSQNFANMQSQSISVASASISKVHIYWFRICGIWHGIGFIVFAALTVGLTNETNFLTAVGASCKFNIMQLFFAESWDAREASKHVP